ncbi:MAG: outer membrane beta-barrel protein [bacterium]|nr:outer membrane beta-barrel protein [bacterium]
MMKGKSFILSFCLALLLWGVPAEATDPPECGMVPTNFSIMDPAICIKVSGFDYDLSLGLWDPLTPISPNIRVGYSWTDTPPDSNPRFFNHKEGAGSHFYTFLYARFRNDSGGAACPDTPISGPVTVSFSYIKSTTLIDPATVSSVPDTDWISIGDYTMKIPDSPGAVLPALSHEQTYPVCWVLGPGERFPAHFAIKAHVSWGHEDLDKLDNNVTYSVFDLSSQKTEAHIAFAMDLSGSMNSNFSGPNSRLVVAKEKAQLFTFLIEDDQWLGVYGFSTGNPANTSFSSTYTGTDLLAHTETLNYTAQIAAMQEITGNLSRIGISNAIAPLTAGGCTPIGQGLLRAKDGIDNIVSADPASKAIVLFSDGFHNVPPYVSEAPDYTCGSHPAYTGINAEETFKENDIPIYSIHFGPGIGMGYDQMNLIKDQTGGDYVYGAATELELAAVYYSIRGMVDDLIYLEKDGQTSAQGPYPQFEVAFDGAADKATVAVAWELGNGETRLTIDRRKKGDDDWIPCDSQPEIISTHVPVSDCVSYPSFQVFRFTAGADTTWEFRVRQIIPGQGQSKFTAAVFSNVEQASIKAALDDHGFAAGKDLPVYVDLHSGGHAVDGAEVKALVRVPKRSFSSTLRKYAKKFVPGMDVDGGKAAAIIPQLQKFLKQDTGSENLYVYKDVVLTLRDDGMGADKKKGDGRYSAVLPGAQTQIAGKYEVTFTAKGALSAGRSFERSLILSTICNVGPADPGKSLVEMSVSQPQPNGKVLVTITILPTDKYGNAAFPGSAYKIKVITQNGNLKNGVVDNQDSSFTQVLELGKGETTDVTVIVGGIALPPVSTGKPPARNHELSLHGGIVVPEGIFDILVSSGKALVFDYGYRFNHNFSVRGALGFNWFNDRFGSGSVLLTNFNAYLQYRSLSGRFVPYFEAGPGFYKLEGGSSSIGYSSGVGVRYILAKHWDFDVSVYGHRAGGKLDLSFVQFLAGFIFKF